MSNLYLLAYLLVGLFTAPMFSSLDQREARSSSMLEDREQVPQILVYTLLGLAWPLSMIFLLAGWVADRTRRRGKRGGWAGPTSIG